MNNKMKKMIGLAVLSGTAAAAGFIAGRMRRQEGKRACDPISEDDDDFSVDDYDLSEDDDDFFVDDYDLPEDDDDITAPDKPLGGEEKHVYTDEIGDYSVDVYDAAMHLLHSARTAEVSRLNDAETRIAVCLLSAYIGFLREKAPSNEQNLATLMLMLVNTENSWPDGRTDAIFQMFEDVTDAMSDAELADCRYYDNYQDYWFWLGDKRPVILACQRAVADIMAEHARCSEDSEVRYGA